MKSQSNAGTLPLSRRRILQLTAAAGGIGLLYYLSSGSRTKPTVVKHTQTMMGTVINITICCDDEKRADEAISACTRRMQRLSDMMSTYVEDSPLSMLNRQGLLTSAPEELIEIFTLSHEISELTGGAFDPTVFPLVGRFREIKKTGVLPSRSEMDELLKFVNYKNVVIEPPNTIRYTQAGTRVTLDGIAKGFIVDQGIKELKSRNLTNAFIEAGGDLMAIGMRQDGTPWRIGIRNPRSDNLKNMDKLSLSDRAIATSGDYLQYFTNDKVIHHIINPFTGYSPVETASSSIIGPTVAIADSLATATMVLGPRAAVDLIETIPDCEGYFFDKQLNKFKTTGFFS